jgi:hypothetical protein
MKEYQIINRKMTQSRYYCTYSSYIGKELHWLPISYIIHFKILLITFKVLHVMAPSYLSSLVSIRSSSSYSLRLNAAVVLITPRVRSHATLGDRSFAMALRYQEHKQFREIQETFESSLFLFSFLKNFLEFIFDY